MTYPSPAVEIFRRLSLVAGIVVAAWLGWLTDFRPYAMVSLPEPDTTASGWGGVEQPTALTVSGPAWEKFFSDVDSSFAANLPVAGWEGRIRAADLKEARKENARRAAMTEEQRQEERESIARVKAEYGVDATFTGSFHQLYFLRDEPPFDQLEAEDGSYVVTLDGRPYRRLEVALLPPHELVPFFDVNTLPSSFSYPARRWSLWALGVGLALFLLLPYPHRPANVVAYRRWRILMGDLASTLLFATFFVLPFPIIGGSVETLGVLPLLIPFWLLASLALLAYGWSAHAAVYCLVMRDGGFDIQSLGGRDAFDYADIREVQGALLRPPRWLVVASFVAVLLGGSRTSQVGQAGRALMLAGSAVDGLRVTAKDGRTRFVWVSDQMGSEAMEHLDAFTAGLEKAGVPKADGVLTVRAVFPPT